MWIYVDIEHALDRVEFIYGDATDLDARAQLCNLLDHAFQKTAIASVASHLPSGAISLDSAKLDA